MRIETFVDHPVVLAHQPQTVHFALKCTAETIAKPRPHPAAFCIVLDRSGSMTGQPLDLARQAAQLVVRNLRPEDLFALVTFESDARTLIPLQPCTDRQAMLDIVGRISSGGSTNLTGGWMLGRDELSKAPSHASRRLLLLSDGQLNQGIVDPAMVRQIVADGLELHHVRTSSIGFGESYNEDLLAELARVTSGQFYHVDSPEQLPAIFASELDGLQKITAQNVRVRVRAGEFCEAFAQLGENPSVSLPDGRVEFSLGDFTSGEERIVCFAVQVRPIPDTRGVPGPHSAGGRIVELEILLDEIRKTGVVSQCIRQSIRIHATGNPTDLQTDDQTMTWVSLQKAAQAMRDVNRAMDNRCPDDAITVVRECVRSLREYGPLAAIGEALRAMEGLELMIAEGWDARSRKSARYRSSSYSKMSSAEMWSLKNEEQPSFKRPRQSSDSSASPAPAAPPPQP